MSGPYRAPDAIAVDGAPQAVAVDLGARRSTHARGGVIGGWPEVALVGFDGAVRMLPRDLEDLEHVLAELDRQVTMPLVARAKEALASGERMVFGPVVVELDGIVLSASKRRSLRAVCRC